MNLKELNKDKIEELKVKRLEKQRNELKKKFNEAFREKEDRDEDYELGGEDDEVVDVLDTEEDKLWDEYYSNQFNIKTSKNPGLVETCKKRVESMEKNELKNFFKK